MKLQLKRVYRSFNLNEQKVNALSDINLTFESGDKVLIVGESGAGKSSLLNIIGLLDSGFEGSYTIDNQDSRTLGSKDIALFRNMSFAYIFQEYALIEQDSVFENVKVPLLYSNLDKSLHKQMILDILHKLEIQDLAFQKVKYLSGGQRQRVAIARALVHNPKIILADEPTGSLDKDLSRRIIDILYDYADESKILIIVTHDFLEVSRNNERVVTLSSGRLVI